MHRLTVLAAVFCASTAAPATGQSWAEGRVAFSQERIHRDSTRRPSRQALFIHRAAVASASALVVAAPLAIVAARNDSDEMWVAGTLAYLATTSVVAASVKGSRNCGRGRRLWLAFGGALAGVVGGTFAAAEAFAAARPDEPHEPLPRPGIVGAIIGVPLGAAAALYTCT
jgi:hypothetical protein